MKNGDSPPRSKRDGAIALISFPYAAPSVSSFLDNIATILMNLSEDLHVIAGKIETRGVSKHRIRIRMKGYEECPEIGNLPRLHWMARFFVIQLELFIRVLQLPRNVNTMVFFPGASYIGPLIAGRARGMRAIIIPGGSVADSVSSYPKLARTFISALEKVAYLMASRVALESERECANFRLRFPSISSRFVSGAVRYVDFTEFEYIPRYGACSSDEFQLLYIGRMASGKGAEATLYAALIAFEKNNSMTLCFAGDGPLKQNIEEVAVRSRHSHRITFAGWVAHKDVPRIFAESSLLVLPSESEGLPTILLESMVSGVIVLATPVGGIPEMIQDGVTGFIIRSTESEKLAEQILRIVEMENLDVVAGNARRYAEMRFDFLASTERFRRILEF